MPHSDRSCWVGVPHMKDAALSSPPPPVVNGPKKKFHRRTINMSVLISFGIQLDGSWTIFFDSFVSLGRRLFAYFRDVVSVVMSRKLETLRNTRKAD